MVGPPRASAGKKRAPRHTPPEKTVVYFKKRASYSPFVSLEGSSHRRSKAQPTVEEWAGIGQKSGPAASAARQILLDRLCQFSRWRLLRLPRVGQQAFFTVVGMFIGFLGHFWLRLAKSNTFLLPYQDTKG